MSPMFLSWLQVYKQLAEADKVRYDKEMKSWENQMVVIGRDHLLRVKSRRIRTSKEKIAKKKKREHAKKKQMVSKKEEPAPKEV